MSAALKKLGDRLREARTAAGLSQAELGAPYFTRAHVSAIELGKIRPAMRSLEHMAKRLGRPPSYFLDDAEEASARRDRELEMTAIGGLLTLGGAAEALLRRVESAKPPDRMLQLRILITLGGSAQDLGEPQAATTYYDRALAWSTEIGDLARITFIHQGLGNVYRTLGDHDAAAGHYQ